MIRRLPFRFAHSLLLCALLSGGGAGTALACGTPDSDCRIGARDYRIVLPKAPAPGKPLGAILFAHGYRGSSAGVMRNRSLIRLANGLGLALVALNAAGHDWALPHAPAHNEVEGVNELAYIDAVIADLKTRHGIDPDRLVASGFSAGGMMTWYLACHRAASFAGFAPMSGTFWRPVPQSCPGGGVDLIHYHGTEDPVVPLGGRPIAETHQGDVRKAIEMMRETGGFTPDGWKRAGDLECETYANDREQRLELCLWPGGHSFRMGFLERAVKAFLE
ncbi:polyhydroxybutyrate depolymerase [Maritimibacter sp. 55A14]|uniref:alpha/beta hydrolase family esterase n=1 Tax=Maritimibacter sp. 55A14 TaxID=2174844 RepID=UPI000D61A975|nr:PHB depolymerase family esterase [Maritimibacter sp. 55A14]PWE33189.1 polyhydroxybutyrate depolymerase [Maritimibacter sp. 55A14]